MSYNQKSAYELLLTCMVVAGTSLTSLAEGIVKDSVGLSKEGGKTFVIYKVQPKQTLYSIVKKYGSSISEFKNANPGASETVKIGQLIRIPYKGLVASTPPSNAYPPRQDAAVVAQRVPMPSSTTSSPASASLPKTVTHVVEPGQGLYGIAAKYRISIGDIRRWNSLSSDNLEVGQVLIIDAAEYAKRANTTSTVGRNDILRVDPPSYPTPTSTQATMAPPLASTTPSEIDSKPTIETSRSLSCYKKTIETGLAEVIDVEDKSGKYLALHRSAPVGTLVNVKNVANGQSIWVKVIGRLPDIGSDKVVIKLSPRAFEKLNPVDKRITTEINYMTP